MLNKLSLENKFDNQI